MLGTLAEEATWGTMTLWSYRTSMLSVGRRFGCMLPWYYSLQAWF